MKLWFVSSNFPLQSRREAEKALIRDKLRIIPAFDVSLSWCEGAGVLSPLSGSVPAMGKLQARRQNRR